MGKSEIKGMKLKGESRTIKSNMGKLRESRGQIGETEVHFHGKLCICLPLPWSFEGGGGPSTTSYAYVPTEGAALVGRGDCSGRACPEIFT